MLPLLFWRLMPYNSGEPATVIQASMTESQKGTLGIALVFQIASGNIEHVLWVTPNTHERVLKSLAVLGLTQQRIDDPATFEDINAALKGATCCIVTGESTYKDKTRTVVKWINESTVEPGGDVISRVYGLLSGKQMPVAAKGPVSRPRETVQQSAMDDESVPF